VLYRPLPASYRPAVPLQTARLTCHHPSVPTTLKGIAAMHNQKPAICFIGLGEAGQAIASGFREAGVETMSA
jgi:hypothetical protein